MRIIRVHRCALPRHSSVFQKLASKCVIKLKQKSTVVEEKLYRSVQFVNVSARGQDDLRIWMIPYIV